MSPDDTLLLPIAGNNPSGISLRYSPTFDEIREARREDDDLPQGEWERPRKTADPDLVIRLTGEALATMSKDLQLAAWRTEALLRRIGIAGLTEGLDLVRELIERFWDSVYPEIDDGDLDYRSAPIDWIGSKLGDYVRRVPLTVRKHDWYAYRESRAVPYEAADEASAAKRADALAERKTVPEDFEAGVNATPTVFYEMLLTNLEGAIASLQKLESVCDRRFYESISFNPLRQALQDVRELVQTQLRSRRSMESDLPVGTGEEDAPAAVAAGPEAVSPNAVLAYAATLRRERASSPMSYLLVRAVRWGEVREAHRISADFLRAPVGSTRERLAAVARGEQWGILLEMSETEMATPAGRGWLDLQRYSCAACEGLGSLYLGVHKSILAETTALLGQFPELPKALLSDGTATADAATLEWLRKNLSGSPGLERLLDGEVSGRMRFVERLQMAKDCVADGQKGVAMALLEELTQEADRRGLDQWESPDLVVEPFVLLFRILESEAAEVEHRRAIFNRICRMHPRLAIAQKLQEPHA